MIRTTVDVPVCMSTEEIRSAMNKDAELQMLKNYILRGSVHIKDEVEPGVERYWPVRHGLVIVIIDGIAMKGRWIIIPYIL